MRRISLKHSILIVAVAISAVLCLMALILFRSLSRSYTSLVFSQSAQTLGLYSQMMEARLASVEEFSADIVSNSGVQDSLRRHLYSPQGYEGHTARQALYSQLFTLTFSNPYLSAATFLHPNGQHTQVSFSGAPEPDAALLERVAAASAQMDGGAVWTADASAAGTVMLSRLVRDASGYNDFQPLGVLVLQLRASELFRHASFRNEDNSSILLPFLGGEALLGENPYVTDREAMDALTLRQEVGSVELATGNYLYLVRRLPMGNWQFVNFLSADRLLSDVNRVQLLYMACWVLVSLAVVWAVFRYAKLISRPMDRLVHFMDRIQQGDYEEIEPDRRREPLEIRELARLTESYNAMVVQIDYLIHEVYERQLMISEMKFRTLQYQINPHFLYNTLETIHWQAMGDGNRQISTMVLSLSNLLRASIGKADVITVREEMALVRDYIAIQQIRFSHRLDFSAEIDEELQDRLIPKLTVQPLVENSIRHRLERFSGVCKISVCSRRQEGAFSILVQDNGGQVDPGHMERVMRGEGGAKGTGLGLKNIHERIGHCFGPEFGLRFHSEAGASTCVEILLPLGGASKQEGERLE